ncbi:MAG TPA: monovalent cation:proton antiporter-2 (CPA2) family protein [Casimicrobiaceae bacterium]|jgi:CPA2 family monovalent cation:H+ antiporter-2|nr:monovalent cation:proton antiporter-2 (CPA2) family protein [Casimicrobiaceae bacterium]
MSHTLQLILLLLAAAVVALIVCRLVRLPPILGYLGVGILVGPHALGWVPDTTDVRGLAEFGIVFLMFSVGLEFSLSQLKAMRRALFGLGLAQVAITTLLAMIGLHLLGDSWLAGFTLGGALAMSSTAIVSKMLAERTELNSVHGRDIMGILLFQDLAVVAFLIAIPTLAAGAADQLRALPLAVAKAAIALAIILVFGQGPMRAWFHVIARQRSSELFMLNVLLVTLGLAALTRIAGLSFALGAFLAGMLIAETEYRYQVEEDIKPFRDVLLGLFFVTVGMYLDLKEVGANLGWVLLLVIIPVLAKLLLVVILARVFRAPLGAALRTGFYLAQAGEFAIVMLALAVDLAIVDPKFAELVVAAMVLSMLAAPLLIQFAEPVARRLSANDWLARAAQVTQIAARSMARQEHVIICGFGRSGQNLARLLEKEEISFIALEADPQRVREAAADGSSVVYGDAGRREALIAAGLPKARAIAVTFADTATALKILYHVQQLRHELPVIVRTVDDAELDRLTQAGATEVVPEVLEGSLMLASHLLLLLGVPLNRVLARIRAIREERYSLFRGFFHGATDAADAAENLQPRLHSVLLTERSAAVGRTLADLDLAGLVEVTSVRRRGMRSKVPLVDYRFDAGDVIVLLGPPENLALAERRLLRD